MLFLFDSFRILFLLTLRSFLNCTGYKASTQLLVSKPLTSNVNDTEPFQFFGIRVFTDVYDQLVVENSFLLVTRYVVEILIIHREGTVHVLTKRDGTLLAVHYLVSRFILVVLVLTKSNWCIHCKELKEKCPPC